MILAVEFLLTFAIAFIVSFLRTSNCIFINSPTHLNHFGFELVLDFSNEQNSIRYQNPSSLHPIAKSLEETATHGLQ
jgi:hypothetical protein